MKRNPKIFLEHILASVELIENYSKNITHEDFAKNLAIQDAIMRRLEIIGEAVKNLSASFKAKYPAVSWKQVAGMRNILIHEYFGVDVKLVWSTVKIDMPVFKKQILEILKKEFGLKRLV